MKFIRYIINNYHYIAIGFWLLMIIPTILWWKNSVLWVAVMSLYANIWVSLDVIKSEHERESKS